MTRITGWPRSPGVGTRKAYFPDPARRSASIRFVRISLMRVRWPSPLERSHSSTCGSRRTLTGTSSPRAAQAHHAGKLLRREPRDVLVFPLRKIFAGSLHSRLPGGPPRSQTQSTVCSGCLPTSFGPARCAADAILFSPILPLLLFHPTCSAFVYTTWNTPKVTGRSPANVPGRVHFPSPHLLRQPPILHAVDSKALPFAFHFAIKRTIESGRASTARRWSTPT